MICAHLLYIKNDENQKKKYTQKIASMHQKLRKMSNFPTNEADFKKVLAGYAELNGDDVGLKNELNNKIKWKNRFLMISCMLLLSSFISISAGFTAWGFAANTKYYNKCFVGMTLMMILYGFIKTLNERVCIYYTENVMGNLNLLDDKISKSSGYRYHNNKEEFFSVYQKLRVRILSKVPDRISSLSYSIQNVQFPVPKKYEMIGEYLCLQMLQSQLNNKIKKFSDNSSKNEKILHDECFRKFIKDLRGICQIKESENVIKNNDLITAMSELNKTFSFANRNFNDLIEDIR